VSWLSTAAAETFYGWLRLMNSTAAARGLAIECQKMKKKEAGYLVLRDFEVFLKVL